MPGIVVGVDGSGHSQRALDWAMKEAALHGVPLTVMTVHELVNGYYGGLVEYPVTTSWRRRPGNWCRPRSTRPWTGWAHRAPQR